MTSLNGFTFTASIDAQGENITLVAHKDDHECRKTEVFRFVASEVHELISLLQDMVLNAKDRRKAIRKASQPVAAVSLPPEGEAR